MQSLLSYRFAARRALMSGRNMRIVAYLVVSDALARRSSSPSIVTTPSSHPTPASPPRTYDAGGCRVVSHPQWGTAVYPATLFARAPVDVIDAAMHAAAATAAATAAAGAGSEGAAAAGCHAVGSAGVHAVAPS